MTESALDKAIREYRENPTEENKQRVLRLQAAQTRKFYSSQADAYIQQTRGR